MKDEILHPIHYLDILNWQIPRHSEISRRMHSINKFLIKADSIVRELCMYVFWTEGKPFSNKSLTILLLISWKWISHTLSTTFSLSNVTNAKPEETEYLKHQTQFKSQKLQETT